MSENPVFIVGASRSGTALLRSSLNRHPALHIAGETHFFDDLRTRLPLDEPLRGAQRDHVVRLFGALSHRPYGYGGEPEQGWLDADELQRRADARGGRADDFLATWCELEGEHEDGVLPRRWGEKTPRHVYRIDELFRAFPGAQVVAMVRDPRAVIASYRDWSDRTGFGADPADDDGLDETLARESARVQKSYHPVLATLMWRATVNRAAAARREHGSDRVRVVRYEDLVRRPHDVLQEVCAWLDEEYHPGMVAVPVHNSSHMSFDAEGGFRADAIDRWRLKLGEDEVALVQLVAGAALRACHYTPVPVQWHTLRAVPHLLNTPQAVLAAAGANRHRMGSPSEYLMRRLRSLV